MTLEDAIVSIEATLGRPLSNRSKRMLELRAAESASFETAYCDGWARALLPMGPHDFYEVRFMNGKPCSFDGQFLLRSGPR